MAVSINSQLL